MLRSLRGVEASRAQAKAPYPRRHSGQRHRKEFSLAAVSGAVLTGASAPLTKHTPPAPISSFASGRSRSETRLVGDRPPYMLNT